MRAERRARPGKGSQHAPERAATAAACASASWRRAAGAAAAASPPGSASSRPPLRNQHLPSLRISTKARTVAWRCCQLITPCRLKQCRRGAARGWTAPDTLSKGCNLKSVLQVPQNRTHEAVREGCRGLCLPAALQGGRHLPQLLPCQPDLRLRQAVPAVRQGAGFCAQHQGATPPAS